MKALTTDDIADYVIGDGEWEAIDAVAGFELPLEVSSPKVVGGEDGVGGFAGMSYASPAAGSGNHTISFEDNANGGTAWKIPLGLSTVNNFDLLFNTPIGVLSSQIRKLLCDMRVGLIGEGMGFSRLVLEGARPFFRVAFNPFVTGLAGDVITITKFGKRGPLWRCGGSPLRSRGDRFWPSAWCFRW